MNYIENESNSALGKGHRMDIANLSQRHSVCCAVGTLTNYKRVVDIDMTSYIKERHKIVHYGLSKNDLELTEQKLKNQKSFFLKR